MKKTKREVTVAEQWIEVYPENGRTRTVYYPSNDEFQAEIHAMSPRPVLVYRRIHFPCGIPKEYLWTQPPDEQTVVYGGGCVQRMTVDTWLRTVVLETNRGDGHVGPTGTPPVPRPKERGGCDCPACVENEDILIELGFQV
jgi:hypothetical protein